VSVVSADDDHAGPVARWNLSHRRRRAARDEEFTAFAAAVAPRLRRTAYLMCRDWHLAQDLTQTTLAKMYASWPRVGHMNVEAYSRRVLMNVLFDQRKRRSDGEVVLAELPEAAGGHPDGSAELHVVLMAALAALPVRDRAIVVLRHWEDLSVDTVAEIVGVSTSVVKMQSARSLSRLRQLLGEDFIMS
jgi:RNA polymerase sigma-70 factor (sigma-E family)